MGRTARDSNKTRETYRISFTESLRDDINDAWKNGPDQDADRQTFLLKLLRLGVEEYRRVERLRERTKGTSSHESGQPDEDGPKEQDA